MYNLVTKRKSGVSARFNSGKKSKFENYLNKMKVPSLKRYNPKSEYQATIGFNKTQKHVKGRLAHKIDDENVASPHR